MSFTFDDAALPPEVRLLPTSGVVPPLSHALVALRYAPAGAPHALSVRLPLVYNHTSANSASLLLTGGCFEPLVTTSLAPANKLYLRPTCAGSASTRALEVVNPGRVPVSWRWALTKRLEGVVDLHPQVRGPPGAGAQVALAGAACPLRPWLGGAASMHRRRG